MEKFRTGVSGEAEVSEFPGFSGRGGGGGRSTGGSEARGINTSSSSTTYSAFKGKKSSKNKIFFEIEKLFSEFGGG
jgi:hypothetical protein